MTQNAPRAHRRYPLRLTLVRWTACARLPCSWSWGMSRDSLLTSSCRGARIPHVLVRHVGVDRGGHILSCLGFFDNGHLIDTRNSRRYLRRFYARRILRIFPIYYVALLFSLFVAPACHLVSQADADQLRENQAWYWTYLVHPLFCFHPTLSIDKFTGHFWSLAVEEQFYLVWPLLVLAISNEDSRRVSLLAIVTAFFRAFLLAAHVGQNWIWLHDASHSG